MPYNVRRDDHRIDMDEVARLAREHRPKVIIAGGSAYPRFIDFAAFRAIADEVGAVLMVDMAHFAGLVAGGVHPSPFPHAHVVTTTTHKTLRGPRGGVVLTDHEDFAKRINTAVFPGLQGGPLMHVIAAKAVAFGEALRPSFKDYARAVVDNAKVLADTLKARGFDMVSGGTDTHLMLVDLRPKHLTGKVAEAALGRAHITCNKNGIPFDPEKPAVTSGVRLGSPACTSRGFRGRRVPRGRRIDCRVAGRTGAPARRGGRRGRGGGARQGPAPAGAVSDLRLRRTPRLRRICHALPELYQPRHPGEGLPSDRGFLGDQAAPPVPRLRLPLHHVRTGAVA